VSLNGSLTASVRGNTRGLPGDRHKGKKAETSGPSWPPSGPLTSGDALDAGRADACRLLRPSHRGAVWLFDHTGCGSLWGLEIPMIVLPAAGIETSLTRRTGRMTLEVLRYRQCCAVGTTQNSFLGKLTALPHLGSMISFGFMALV